MDEKNRLNGITLHGVPIEDKLKSIIDEECSRQFQETVLEKKRLMPPIYCKSKYKQTKEKNSMTRHLTQQEINSQYLDKNLMKCKTQKEFVICILLSGGIYTNNELFEEFKARYSISLHRIKRPASVTTIATLMIRLQQTELSKYMEFSKADRKIGDKYHNVKTYKMRQQGLELKPKEAFELAKKRITVEKKSWEKVREDHSFTKSPILNEIPPLSDNLKYNIPKHPGEKDITWEPKEDETHYYEDLPQIGSTEPTTIIFKGVKVQIDTNNKFALIGMSIEGNADADGEGFTISATFK